MHQSWVVEGVDSEQIHQMMVCIHPACLNCALVFGIDDRHIHGWSIYHERWLGMK
jgi:hypothetical protein